MGIDVKNAVIAANQEAQYDEKAKHLLGNKIILAHILAKTVDAFKGMNPKDIVPFIEGEPFIGTVPVEPGLTNIAENQNRQKVIGFNSENSEINEGLIKFDIVFYVHMKDGLSQIIVNVESQKEDPNIYDILNRAVFYVCRLISSQKGRDFEKTNYNDIRRVYSIWICLNTSQNSMNHVHLTNDAVIGSYHWKGKIDLLNIVLLGLTNDLPEYTETYELHRLLSTLLSKNLSINERLNILEMEYEIPTNKSIKEDISVMCNLSQAIKEEGISIGIKDGVAIGRKEGISIGIKDGIAIGKSEFIINMHKKGYTLEQISDIADKDIQEIKDIIEKTK